MRRFLFLPLLLLLVAASATAGVVVEARIDDSPWQTGPVSPLRGQRVALRVQPRPGATIRWYRIVPDLSHPYQNADFPWDPHPYRWRGYDRIRYRRVELTHLRGRWTIEPFPVSPVTTHWWQRLLGHRGYEHTDVGSFWFQAEVSRDGRTEHSPGIAEADARGLSPRTMRVSIRDGEGVVGWLTSFHNVPGLFGSTTYQSRHYLGVDCADVVAAALALADGQTLSRNWNVAGLVEHLPRRATCHLHGGRPDRELRWGREVRRGDPIAVRYRGWRQFGHIGVLVGDGDGDGVLGPGDRVLHAGPDPLHESLLGDGAFDGEIVILVPSLP